MTINPPNLYPAYLITQLLELVQFQNYEKTEGAFILTGEKTIHGGRGGYIRLFMFQ